MPSGGGPKPRVAYYRSLVDYNRAIMNVHYRKGSLLDYDGVYLAEGPWPGKAYFDAMRQARKRDAGLYMDYGYTRPNVVSQGPVQQGCSPGCETGGPQLMETPGASPDQVMPEGQAPAESLPAPANMPIDSAPPAETSSGLWYERTIADVFLIRRHRWSRQIDAGSFARGATACVRA